MAAKEVKFHTEAREKMLRGVDILANAVKTFWLSDSSSATICAQVCTDKYQNFLDCASTGLRVLIGQIRPSDSVLEKI